MTRAKSCASCGAVLAADTPEGLCPQCLLNVGLAATVDPAETVDGIQMETEPTDAPQEGKPFGDYRIIRPLGKGGMGEVFEAEHSGESRRVALKVLAGGFDSPEARSRFLREGRLAAPVNHPHSVYVFGTEEIRGVPVITMELMPGGTLHDRFEAGGRPVSEAVDATLQAIAGLEAAWEKGVLHRDIKPANLFLDTDGSIKVGDYGLSISTRGRAGSAITGSKSVLGTPAFASPEQLRGDDLDVRSDIYAVGATLYYLLTGRTPFSAANLPQLIASVLEEPVESPARFRPEIPERLAQVVLRCLAKRRADRPATYDELRKALLPFSSRRHPAAGLPQRLAAGIVDVVLLTVAIVAVDSAVVETLVEPERPDLARLLRRLFPVSVWIAYFSLSEGVAGASLGKRLNRLQVTDVEQRLTGIGRTVLRAATFTIVPALAPGLLNALVPAEARAPGSPLARVGVFSFYIALALLFSTARRRNGLAAVHDLISKTRVIAVPAARADATVASVVRASPPRSEVGRIGPYHVLESIGEANRVELLLAYDPELLLRRLPVGAAPVEAAVQTSRRAGRIRWLGGRRSKTESWDVYEALSGKPLLAVIEDKPPWSEVRAWLLQIAEELSASEKENSAPSLQLDRVWITGAGRVKLLDFAAPGAELPADGPVSGSLFLKQVAVSLLAGRALTARDVRGRAVELPLPLRAKRLLDRIEEVELLDDVVVQLRSQLDQPAVVSRRKRFDLVLGCWVLPLFLCLPLVFGWWLAERAVDRKPELFNLAAALERLEEFASAPEEASEGAKRERNALEVYVASTFRGIERHPLRFEEGALSLVLSKKERALAEEIAGRVSPSPRQVEEAESLLAPLFAEEVPKERRRFDFTSRAMFMGALFLGVFFFLVVPVLSAAVLLRRGLLLRLFGIAIVRRDGAEAGRARMLWRAFVAWSPVIVSPVVWLLLFLLTLLFVPEREWTLEIAFGLYWIAYACAAGWAIVTPRRSLQDRLAGTWLVPG